MIKKTVVPFITAAFMIVAGCAGKEGEFKKISKQEMDTKALKESYVIGIDLAKRLEMDPERFDADAFIQGFTDQIKKKPYIFSEDEMDVVRKEGMKEAIKANSPESRSKLSPEGNVIASERFMLENQKKEGVITSESGLQYLVINQTKGTKPGLSDKVKIHYVGTTRLGEEFENTFKSGNPAVAEVGSLVPGFQEGLMLMSPGSRYKLFIPPKLGYGAKQYASLEPHSILIIEVELLEIIKK